MESSAAGRRPEFSLALTWAAALLALAAWLGHLDLLDPDETRHAEIAREMLGERRWLVPVLHGEPYHQKPAAFYWLLAGSLGAFGENAAAARLPSVAAALLTIFVTARFARRAYGREAAAFAVAGLATTVAFVVLGRTVVVDMAFTAALTTAFAWLGLWRLDAPAERRSIWPFYVAIALGVLLKGPAAAILAALVMIGVAIVARDARLLRAMRPIGGTVLVIALAAPWYAAAASADADYMRELVLRQNVERYLRPIGAGHAEPWYYYLIALPVGMLPWTPVVAAALAARLRRATRSEADVYCAIWAGAVLVFFLPASTKLLTYLLPAFPPLICLAAAWAGNQAHGERSSLLAPYAAAWTLIGTLAGVTACVYVAMHTDVALWRAALALLPLAAFAIALRKRRAADLRVHLATAAAGTLAMVAVAYGLLSCAINEYRDSRAGAHVLRASTSAGAEVVAYRCTPHALAFYARKPAVRTRDPRRALGALEPQTGGALITEKKRLAELGLEPLPSSIRRAWENGAGLVMLVAGAPGELRGGEGRESNPPPTVEAGITVLKTGRATGPDPSP